ncbi:fused MFS/spermidine synthase, partial [Candidatus Latescibacterota bacterium]
FVGSGCSALIYEIVWFQMLQLVIGSSAVSLGVLLGTYMGGMFLGSIFLPRILSEKAHPLRVYGLLELGIGIVGLLVLFYIPYLDRIYIAIIGRGYASTLIRGAVCALCLLPPTMFMGATLPVIARWVEKSSHGMSWLGFFYGGNIGGAVFGCLLAGFYLLRSFDVSIATYVAVSINIAVTVIALFLASQTPYEKPAQAVVQNNSPRVSGFQPVYLVILISGLCALGAEVVWTRLISLILGGSVYTFSIILAVFLTGLGIGSSIGSVITRKTKYPHLALGICQLLLTVTIAWGAFIIIDYLPSWPLNPSDISNPWHVFLLDLLQCFIIVLPASILWGASFPLALASVLSRDKEQGRLVGEVYGANTFGAICGAVGFSVVIIPQFGTQFAQQLIIWLSGAAALIMFTWQFLQAEIPVLPFRRFGLRGLSVVCAGLALILGLMVPETFWGVAAYGRNLASWADNLAPGITQEKDIPTEYGIPEIYCTYFGEGMSESLAVTKTRNGVRSFHASGKVQASSHPDDMRLQRMLGHITALTHKDPRSVLIVACGAGVTAGSFVPYPSIERIVICELEKLVTEFAAPQFETENYGVLKDPRTEVVIDDGRHFVQTTTEKFDIITSDPIDPWIKGSAALYTEEYFAICREHLNPGGIMALWIPFYESSSESVKSLVATFFNVYPESIIWSNDTYMGGYDAVLFGFTEPTQIDLDEAQRRLESPEFLRVANSLKEIGFNSAIDLYSTFAAYGPNLEDWLKDAQINTDRNLRLQYLAGMSMDYFFNVEILDEILQYYSFPFELFSGSERSILDLKNKMEYWWMENPNL